MNRMTKDELVEIIKGLLKTDVDLNFLLILKKEENQIPEDRKNLLERR